MTRRYPLDALLCAAGGPTHATVAEAVGIPKETVRAWAVRGVPVYAADRLAVALGFHPYCIWPSWFEDSLKAALPKSQTKKCARQGCDERFPMTHHRRRFCSARCKNLVSSKKWKRQHQAETLEYRQTYYAENRDYELRRQRAYAARRSVA